MEFKERFQNLTTKILQNKMHITNEESTKHALIIPFINLLGYDTSNPLEFQSEYSAGFDKEKEKVDYAIIKNGKIIMLIEAKPVNDPLYNHNKQLAKYFNSTREVKFGLLTNGVKYKFYSDLNDSNMLDELPFFEFSFENVNDTDVEILQRFCNDVFEVNSMVTYAEELAYSSKIKPAIIKLLRNPSDELVRLIIKKIEPDAKVSQGVIARYRDVTKNSITDAMIEMFRQGIVQQPVGSFVPTPEEQGFEEDVNVNPEDVGIKGLPRMSKLFEWGIIQTGNSIYLKNHPQEKAVVLNGKEVEYKGKVLSFNQWGQQVTGWNSICIYDLVIVEGQTETLSVLRQNKMMELGIAKT